MQVVFDEGVGARSGLPHGADAAAQRGRLRTGAVRGGQGGDLEFEGAADLEHLRGAGGLTEQGVFQHGGQGSGWGAATRGARPLATLTTPRAARAR